MSRKTPARPPADVNAPDKAVKWFRDRLLMTDDEFISLSDATHNTAFTMAGVNQLDLVEDVWSQLDRAIANGETLQDFQERMGDRLASAWGGEQPWRIETIFRTQSQMAYSAGRWQQMNDPAIQEARPYRRFSAVLDQRTTQVCEECDGTIRPIDDPWWNERVPPLHYNCRSHIVTLSDREAEDEGVTPDPTDTTAADGFGAPPTEYDPNPDLSEYPSELAAAYSAT